MEMIGQIHTLGSFLRNTNSATHKIPGWVGPGTGLDGFREEIALPLSVFERRTVQPPASRYS
jgi:hypothetical protein